MDDTLPESVLERIDGFMVRAALMTPAELRQYVTLLCVASYLEGERSVQQQLKGALAP